MCVYVRRFTTAGRIDIKMVQEYQKQTIYWFEFLKRVVATVKLLATLGFRYRRHDNSKI